MIGRRLPGLAGAWQVDVGKLEQRLDVAGRRLMTRFGNVMRRELSRTIPVDTGFARAKIGYAVAPNGRSVSAGIVKTEYEAQGRNVMRYPAMMELGIKGHYVYLVNRDGTLKDGFVNWLRRKGKFNVTVTTSRTGKLRASPWRVWVWGYRRPWLSDGFEYAKQSCAAELAALRGTL